jgi:Flp pilus assembly protein TadG
MDTPSPLSRPLWKNAVAGFRSLSRRLRTDAAGSVLPMAAIGLVVSAAMVGGGIDMSRAYRVKSRLQSACDAGVLAGRRSVTTNGFDATAQQAADTYFNVNFDDKVQTTHDTLFDPTSTDNGNTVNGSASTKMDMVVMQMFGKKAMNIAVNCTSTMSVGNADVTMVLDTTGSMSSLLSGTSTSRIEALRTAMKNFYSTIATATQSTNARIRYAFVPYSTTVNVGRLLYDLDPDYIVNSWTIQSREAVNKTTTQKQFTGWATPVNTSSQNYSDVTIFNTKQYSGTAYNNNNKCSPDLPADTPWSNNGDPTTTTTTTLDGNGQQVVTTITTQPQSMSGYQCQRTGNKYYIYSYDATRNYVSYQYATSAPVYSTVTVSLFDHWIYKPVTYDVSQFKAFQPVSTNTGTNGAAVSSTWGGCIEERATVNASSFSNSTATGMSPSGAEDLDIDSAPDPSDSSTQWAPLWPQVAYYRSTVDPATSGSQASSWCPTQATTLATMSQSAFDAYADSLTPNGDTYHDIGMLWGGRISSPQGIFADNVNEDAPNGGNVSRHIIFMTDGEPNAENRIQQAYGIEFLDRRITQDGSTDDDKRHENRFRAICDALKGKGIRIWVIAFTGSLTSDLSYCASDDSAFTATNASQLNDAFQSIAKNVSELRIIK